MSVQKSEMKKMKNKEQKVCVEKCKETTKNVLHKVK